jgi:hypothetical protein
MQFDPHVQGRWKVALLSGGVSAGILFSRLALEHLGFLVLPFSVLGSLLGFLLGVLSIAAREKKRLFAVPAIALSLVCPYHLLVSFYEAHAEV